MKVASHAPRRTILVGAIVGCGIATAALPASARRSRRERRLAGCSSREPAARRASSPATAGSGVPASPRSCTGKVARRSPVSGRAAPMRPWSAAVRATRRLSSAASFPPGRTASSRSRSNPRVVPRSRRPCSSARPEAVRSTAVRRPGKRSRGATAPLSRHRRQGRGMAQCRRQPRRRSPVLGRPPGLHSARAGGRGRGSGRRRGQLHLWERHRRQPTGALNAAAPSRPTVPPPARPIRWARSSSGCAGSTGALAACTTVPPSPPCSRSPASSTGSRGTRRTCPERQGRAAHPICYGTGEHLANGMG